MAPSNIYWMLSGIVLCAFDHLVRTALLQGKPYYNLYVEKETEA